MKDANSLGQGWFAGKDKSGRPVLYETHLTCDCLGQYKEIAIGSTPYNPSTDGLPITAFGLRSATPIFNEPHDQGVPKSYLPARKDREAATTVYFTEQIITRAKDERIAGKVQAIELQRDASKSRWIRRCPMKSDH
jgi:hypothetical protein